MSEAKTIDLNVAKEAVEGLKTAYVNSEDKVLDPSLLD